MDLTQTTTAMLEGLHDPANEPVWEAFDLRYRPIIIGFARNLGLDEADAADIAQETLSRFVHEYRLGKYDRNRGRLGAWLVGIARYRIATLRRDRAGKYNIQGDSVLADLDNDERLSVIWEDQRRQQILRQAMDELKTRTRVEPKTISAFEMLVVHQLSPQNVAEEMGMSVHDVYLAKSRVAQKLRDIVNAIETSYDEEG